MDLTLQPGIQEQTITITEALPLVETTNATMGGTLSNQTINDLPLNGRNYINLLTLRPGMTVFVGGGSNTRSANGTRSEDIGYLIDGLREDDPYTGSSVLNAAIAAGDSSTSLPIDAIQEFNTEQNPKAEFGWKPGAIVSAGLKSGSNTIHGTALAFGRTTSLDARNAFDAAPLPKAAIALEQFGASVGGPIKKDKLFYFLNYEGQRYTVGTTLYTTPPLTVTAPGKPDAKHSLVDACNAVTFAKVNPLSAQIAGLNSDCSVKPPNYTPGTGESLFPTNTGSDPNGVILGLTSTNSQNNGVGKVDYHISDHHSLSGMFFRGIGGGLWNDTAWEVGAPGSSNSPFMSSLFGYILAGSGAWTWTPNSTMVNEFRVGYSSYRQYYDSLDGNVNPLAHGINTGVTDPRFFGFPLIRIDPFSFTTFRLGGNWPKHTGPDGSLQIMEHVSLLRGKHTFKFGGEVIQNHAKTFITANGRGRIRFGSLSAFLTGTVKGSGSILLTGDPERHLSNQQYAAFMQDDWRITPRLTFNLGLRYELSTVLKDSDSKLGNFDPNSPTGLVQVGHGETASFHGDHNNFSPRLGFAWDIGGNGKTVIRGGGSIMYEQLPFSVFIAVANVLGLNQVPTGATQIFCSANPCVNGSTQISRAGPGNMGVVSDNVPGSVITPGWQAQTAPCVSGGTTACGSIFPQSIFNLQCGDGLTVPGAAKPDPVPCNTEAVDPNLRTPYIGTWTLDLQRAITSNLSIDIAYVGNHGTKFLGFSNLNQPPLGVGWGNPAVAGTPANICVNSANYSKCSPSAALETAAEPFLNKFPYIGQVDRLSNLDHSNYNGLQVTFTERPSHGLSFLGGYTYSHGLDNSSINFNRIQLPPDSSHPTAGLYGNSDFDIRHRFTFSTSYVLPGKKSVGQLLEGWQVNSVVTLQTGSPWAVTDFTNDFSGNNAVNELDPYGQPWSFFGNPSDFTSRPTAIPFFSGSSNAACLAQAVKMDGGAATGLAQASLANNGCFARGNSVMVPPAFGTIGNAQRNIFRDSGFKNWDVSVIKDIKIKERLTTQFRAEFFNVLNHVNFTNPYGPADGGFHDPSSPGTFGCGCNTPDQVAPNAVLGTGGARSIQLGLKLIW